MDKLLNTAIILTLGGVGGDTICSIKMFEGFTDLLLPHFMFVSQLRSVFKF